MCDLQNKLCNELNIQLDKNTSIIWADNIVLLSESEGSLNTFLQDLQEYSETNDLEVNIKKLNA